LIFLDAVGPRAASPPGKPTEAKAAIEAAYLALIEKRMAAEDE
jgi:hypothetical protein